MAALERNESEISPSTLYAIACILEGVPFINGSPQNTFVPGVIDMAIKRNVIIRGDDFKSGQTKMKSVLVDFLVGAGIKPTSIVSYNHLGNNDGFNLSAPQTFRSKEISKSNVVDDMVASNGLLYDDGEHPDHVVVIKCAAATACAILERMAAKVARLWKLFTFLAAVTCARLFLRPMRHVHSTYAGMCPTSLILKEPWTSTYRKFSWVVKAQSQCTTHVRTRSWQLRSFWTWSFLLNCAHESSCAVMEKPTFTVSIPSVSCCHILQRPHCVQRAHRW